MPELSPLGSVRGALSNERPYRDRLPRLDQEPKQLRNVGKPNDTVKVFPLEQVLAKGLDLPSLLFQDVGVQENGHELVAATADLGADLDYVEVKAEGREGSLPSFRMKIDAVDEGPVDIEDNGGGTE